MRKLICTGSILIVVLSLLIAFGQHAEAQESTLQDWFDSNGYAINVTIDETGIETFPSGSYEAKILDEIALYDEENSYGTYVENGTQLEEIFSGSDGSGSHSSFVANETFGMYLNSSNTTNEYFYSETSLNSDDFDHLWVFLDPTTPNGYILAWEDGYQGGDADYQDAIISLSPTPQIIEAVVDVHPESLNLGSKGRWITVFIKFPDNTSASEVNVSSVMLNGTIPVNHKPVTIEDVDEDGSLELMVKFDRFEVISYVLTNANSTALAEMRFTDMSFIVSGALYDGTLFHGSDVTKTIYKSGPGMGATALLD